MSGERLVSTVVEAIEKCPECEQPIIPISLVWDGRGQQPRYEGGGQ